MLSLWPEIQECMNLLDAALLESKRKGDACAVSEAHYQTVKAARAYELKDGDKLPVTFISIVIKGQPDVAAAMEERDRSKIEYENAREAVNVYKKKLDTLREEHAREWSQAGRIE